MTANQKTFAFSTLEETGDTWLLIARENLFFVDLALADLSLEHKTVCVIGRVGMSPSAPGIVKLIVDKLVSHNDIAQRPYENYKSGYEGSADGYWSRVEHELRAF